MKRNKVYYEDVKSFVEQEGYKLLSKSYKNAKTKLHIICKDHGIFSMNWNNFKTGQRCKKCSKSNKFSWDKTSIKNLLKDTDYIYFGHRKENRRVYVTVTCKNSHRSEVRIDSIVRGQGCFECAKESLSLDIDYVRRYIEDSGFILLSDTYKNNRQLLSIKCPVHGEFSRCFGKFRVHSTCPFCSSEKNVRETKCRNIFEELLKVPFPCGKYDFLVNHKTGYLLELDGFNNHLKLAFEYDGIQHHEPVDYFGGKNAYENRIYLDNLKNKLCKENNITLIRIPYYIVDLRKFIKKELLTRGYLTNPEE